MTTQKEIYIYGMSRPPMYATCPEGFIEVTRSDHPDLPDFYPFFAAYHRQLTREEQKKWEMRPASPGAYKYQVGDVVDGKYPKRILSQGINWYYEVEYVLPEDHTLYGSPQARQMVQEWELGNDDD